MRAWVLIIAALPLLGGSACDDNSAVISEKLDKLDQRLIDLEEKADNTEQWTREIGKRLDADDDNSSLGARDTVADRLARIERSLDRVQDKLDKPGAFGAARPPSALHDRPDPAAVYAVGIDGAPFRGARDATVTIVKGYEYACPFCQRVRPTLDQLLRDYKGDLKIVYRHLVVHPQTAYEPAWAACAAGRQGKFDRMDDLIWDEGFAAGRNLSRDHMETLARKAGLDLGRFRTDRDGPCKKTVIDDQAALARVGLRGTPGFYINGRFLSGAQPLEAFKRLIEEELTKANARIKAGTRRADYYDEFVIGGGKTSL